MRKTPDPNDPNRLLCVNGHAIHPIRLPLTEKTRWGERNVRLFHQDPEESTASSITDRKPAKKAERKVLHLNVTNCRSSSVRSGLLRQIHETVEVDDFRRLLGKLIKTKEIGEEDRRSKVLSTRLYADSLHRELNRHVEVLKTLADNLQDSADRSETTTNA